MAKPESERNEKTERYDLKLKEILHKSAQVFAEKGFHNASVRDISRVTGVSLAGLYYYFQTKEQLLYLILDEAFNSVMENLDNSLHQYEGPDQIRFFIRNHLQYFVENLAEMRVVSHESDSLTGPYQRKIQEKKRAYFKRLTEILAGQPGARGNGIDPKIAALCLFGMINWVYTWYDPEKDGSVERVASVMSEIFLFGYLRS